MLNLLHIENVAVIEKADISFSPGLNVLTGETGAGKSIIIDSIGAVTGSKASHDLIRRGADYALISAVFENINMDWLKENDIEADDEVIVQRKIMQDGKNSCKINGVPVTVTQLRDFASGIVDIHGQNDGRALLDEKTHLKYLDKFGNFPSVINSFKEAFRSYVSVKDEIDKLTMDEFEKERLFDTLTYQIKELESAELQVGEYDKLCARRDLLRNSEKLTEALGAVSDALYGNSDSNAVSLVNTAAYYIQKASEFSPDLSEINSRINDAAFQLSDISELVKDYIDSLEFSPDEYDRLETRISEIRRLTRKYSREEDELIAYLDECRSKLDDIQYADDKLVKLNSQLEQQVNKCVNAAAALTEARNKSAGQLEERIVKELKDLNMPSVRFKVILDPVNEETGFCSFGAENVRFVMSSNAGEELGRISKIASGGELSRIMLALKNVFAENDAVSTMIFDEIDTGVSGIAGQKVAEKLYSVSNGRQVMCVTHLPQIAAMADSQLAITKSETDGRTYTSVSVLDYEGRKRELARLYGGDNITETTLMSADEQLQAATHFKTARK